MRPGQNLRLNLVRASDDFSVHKRRANSKHIYSISTFSIDFPEYALHIYHEYRSQAL